MNLLCFDVSSGGISAAVFDSNLEVQRIAERKWSLDTDDQGAATLSLHQVVERFKQTIHDSSEGALPAIDAICIGTFMHNFVLLNDADEPVTPVFTWLDRRGESGVEYLRARLGDRFHELTGCRYHPMFPVFKLVAMRLEKSEIARRAKRLVSVKAFILHRLTGMWVEDHGMASSSGLFNITSGKWDEELLKEAGFDTHELPPIASRTQVAGRVTPEAAGEFGLIAGIPLIVGSGDGFLANVGSDCEVPAKIAVTLGTSAVVRQTLEKPVLDSAAGTFCYLAEKNTYLLGCAGSNGGNVLDWGRQILGTLQNADASTHPPIFIPLLHGERSPDWNPNLTGSWHGVTARHAASDLARSIVEGIVFNLAHFIEIVQQASGEPAADLVLSGNGFLHPLAAPILATVTGKETWIPKTPGLGSLRGAGICALRALGAAVPKLQVDRIARLEDPEIVQRYVEYRRLRSRYL
jgi:gluconokinase